DCAEVNALALLERVLSRLPAIALADRPLEPELRERGRELVQAAGRRRPDGADDGARPRRRRARVIDDLALDVDRQSLALLDQRQESAVSSVTRRIDDARDAAALTRLERC